ncbi:MAG TPA: thiamine-phosphate kinase [Polyangiaceae bacterium]|nr:thiamine-phosphate kinase [Polyangiaceae bacterium]
MTEARIIADLLRQFGTKHRQVELGIGDDAAVLQVGTARLVWTVDACVEDVHFQRSWLTLSELGARATHAAASDLAAMGAVPLAMLANLALPPGFSRAELKLLAKGQARAARELGCPVVGGNLTRADTLSITTTVLGTARKPLRRDGAQVGDELWLFGKLGVARAGLLSLLRGSRVRSNALKECVTAWRKPRALLTAGRSLVGRAHATLDISDGLSEDAGRLAAASGVKLVVDEPAFLRALPAALHRVARELGETPLDLALAGGEDYALLATGPRRKRPKGVAVIGEVRSGRGVVLRSNGRERPISQRGFDHFR